LRRHTTYREGGRSTDRVTFRLPLTRSLPVIFEGEGPRGLLTFSALSVKMLREHETHPRYHRKDFMKMASLDPMESHARSTEVSGVVLCNSRSPRELQQRRAIRRNVHAGLWMALIMALLGLMSACSSEPEKPAEPAKPDVKGPELITARSAFQKLYVAARGWN